MNWNKEMNCEIEVMGMLLTPNQTTHTRISIFNVIRSRFIWNYFVLSPPVYINIYNMFSFLNLFAILVPRMRLFFLSYRVFGDQVHYFLYLLLWLQLRSLGTVVVLKTFLKVNLFFSICCNISKSFSESASPPALLIRKL